MSPQQRAQLRASALTTIINALITAVVALFLTRGVPGLVSVTLNAKESVSAHRADMQRIDDRIERILDVVCEREPKARACTQPMPPGNAAGEVAP